MFQGIGWWLCCVSLCGGIEIPSLSGYRHDITRHGYIEKRRTPLSNEDLASIYSQVTHLVSTFKLYRFIHTFLDSKSQLFPLHLPLLQREKWYSHSSNCLVCVSLQRFWWKVKRGTKISSLPSAQPMYDFRLKYVKWLQKFIKVDIYGEYGPLSCGSSRNKGNEYKLTSDPCFDLANKTTGVTKPVPL